MEASWNTWTKCSPEVPAHFFRVKKNHDLCCSHLKPAFGDLSRCEMRCIKTLAPQIGNPNCATRVLITIFGGESFATWWILLGLGPWRMVKFVVNLFKEENKSKKQIADSSQTISPHTQTTYLLRNFAWNFAGKTSPAKIPQQNLASYLHVTKKHIALVGTYTNMHVRRYELGNKWTTIKLGKKSL